MALQKNKKYGEKLNHGGAADTAGLPSARHKANLTSHTEQTLLQHTGRAHFLYTQGKDSLSVNTRRPTFCHTEKTSLLHAQSCPPPSKYTDLPSLPLCTLDQK